MRSSDIIRKIEGAGFHLEADGDDIIVTPPGQLSDTQRQFLRDHKPAILDALRQPGAILDADQAGNDIEPAKPIMVEAWTPAGARMLVEATSAEQAEFIMRMNPAPGMVRRSEHQRADVSDGNLEPEEPNGIIKLMRSDCDTGRTLRRILAKQGVGKTLTSAENLFLSTVEIWDREQPKASDAIDGECAEVTHAS